VGEGGEGDVVGMNVERVKVVRVNAVRDEGGEGGWLG
jgi:hypothetical protein